MAITDDLYFAAGADKQVPGVALVGTAGAQLGTAASPLYVAAGTSGGAARTPAYSRVTDAATIAAGAKSVTIKNVGGADGTVLTVALPVGESITFSVDGADTLAAIAYVATGTTFAIAKVT